ncbi:fumarylacetoacetate hydrolase family protein [Acrocarpospora pleiomorpha]|uniref:fumarylacetoacetate hydrolase family protein n=1 Tax=Acrocarpospora pleiomorpha TaxID=90975 RepID=UPI0012D36069|nr:fumarylacetoacetate hydrolase family protein [Acrocarpospora pleiomorpha]
MRLLRVGDRGGEKPAVLADDGRLLDLGGLLEGRDLDGSFFASDGISRIRTAVAEGALPELDGDGLRIGAPIARPGKVVCIGLNYRDHAEESGAQPPAEPVVFMKASNTVVGPFDEVLIPRASTKTDWEAELAVIIGRTARYLESHEAALDCIVGYAISNDVSEREFQLERGGQWDKGKSCETFNPLGPWLVTADEISDPQRLGLRLWVNGQPRQDGDTKNMIFEVVEIVRYLSWFMVLDPGDVINTGTPAGVGLGGYPYLREGDVMELEIDGLGRQRQTVGQA